MKPGKPGPKPKADSLTEAPVLSIKMPPTLLAEVKKLAAERGLKKSEAVRTAMKEGIDWWKSLTPAQKARICGRPAPAKK